jgi:hypothetical protein
MMSVESYYFAPREGLQHRPGKFAVGVQRMCARWRRFGAKTFEKPPGPLIDGQTPSHSLQNPCLLAHSLTLVLAPCEFEVKMTAAAILGLVFITT